jgi:hypothetical protein
MKKHPEQAKNDMLICKKSQIAEWNEPSQDQDWEASDSQGPQPA